MKVAKKLLKVFGGICFALFVVMLMNTTKFYAATNELTVGTEWSGTITGDTTFTFSITEPGFYNIEWERELSQYKYVEQKEVINCSSMKKEKYLSRPYYSTPVDMKAGYLYALNPGTYEVTFSSVNLRTDEDTSCEITILVNHMSESGVATSEINTFSRQSFGSGFSIVKYTAATSGTHRLEGMISNCSMFVIDDDNQIKRIDLEEDDEPFSYWNYITTGETTYSRPYTYVELENGKTYYFVCEPLEGTTKMAVNKTKQIKNITASSEGFDSYNVGNYNFDDEYELREYASVSDTTALVESEGDILITFEFEDGTKETQTNWHFTYIHDYSTLRESQGVILAGMQQYGLHYSNYSNIPLVTNLITAYEYAQKYDGELGVGEEFTCSDWSVVRAFVYKPLATGNYNYDYKISGQHEGYTIENFWDNYNIQIRNVDDSVVACSDKGWFLEAGKTYVVIFDFDGRNEDDSSFNPENYEPSADCFTIALSSTERKITFDANGGTSNTKTKTVPYEEKYGVLPTPTRNGYLFMGWYTAKSGGTKITENSVVKTTKDQTLYAHWKAEDLSIDGICYIINEDDISIGCAATTNASGVMYKWMSYNLDTGSWNTISDWNAANWSSWKPEAGNYWLQVQVKTSNGTTKDYTICFAVDKDYTAEKLTLDGFCYIYQNDRIDIGTAYTTNCDNVQFRWIAYNLDTGVWSDISGWTSGNWTSWQPTAGNYWVVVQAKTPNGEIIQNILCFAVDKTYGPQLNLNGICYIWQEDRIDVGVAYDCTDPNVEFKWMAYNLDTKTWSVITDWNSGNWASWKPKAGNYWLMAQARMSDGTTKDYTICFCSERSY